MLFTFKPLSIKCNSVLSGKESDWGEADGIRVYFLVFTASGFRQILISGREYPPPAVVDTYSFVPGKTLELNSFPPINGLEWETAPVDVGETDVVGIAVVGVNEGLPWIGGGGGFGGTGKAEMDGFKALVQKLAAEAVKQSQSGIFAGATAAAGIAFVFKELENLLDELNNAPDCRGVAFAFEIGLSMKRLFQEHIFKKRTTLSLNASTAAGALYFSTLAKRHPRAAIPIMNFKSRLTGSSLLTSPSMIVQRFQWPGPLARLNRHLVSANRKAVRAMCGPFIMTEP